jgi:hypothetical protein
VSPSRCNFNRLKLLENPRLDDDLRHSIDRLNNLRFDHKFLDELKDKNQLQRFLESLNYVSEYFHNLRKICCPLFERLPNKPPP